MGSSLTPGRVRQMRSLFEQVVTLPPAERASTLKAATQNDADLGRRIDALLILDARAKAVLRLFGLPEPDSSSLSAWDRVRALFDQIVGLPDTERQALLDVLTEHTEPLRGDLFDLVAAHDDDPGVLDVPSAETSPATPPPQSRFGVSDPLLGTTISHYRILSPLGEGGMGIVYTARDMNLDRTVAIKFLPAALHEDADADARFVHEARAVSAIDHPNIAVVHEIGRSEDGRRFIVMAYYAGETLRQKISHGPLPMADVIDYALQLAQGLQQAHEHGIIHRDVKPENAIVTRGGLLKILDFGLAKRQDVQLTATGMMMGTLAYMSPEQTFGGEVDQRTDIWALGVVLFEMLTGQHPFKLENTHLPAGSRDSIIEAAKVLRPEAPEQLLWIIDILLQRHPDQRYQEMSQVVEFLKLVGNPSLSAQLTSAMVTQAMSVPAHLAGSVLQIDAPDRSTKWVPGTLRGRLALGAGVLLVAFALGFLVVNRQYIRSAISSDRGTQEESTAARERARELTRSGLNYFSDGQFALAHTEFERAIAADSTYSEAWSSLAAVHYRRRAFDEAIAANRTSIRLDSSNSTAYYNLANVYEESGRLDDALESYAAALDVDSTLMPVYSAIGNLQIKLGDAEAALRVLERGARVDPGSDYMFLILKNMGKARLAMGDPAAAVVELERSLQLRPGWPETLSLLAESHAALDHTEQSRTYLQQYLDVEPDASRREEVLNRLNPN